MRVRIHRLTIITKREPEVVDFNADVTFIHGPVSTGKSTTVRLVDYCLGGGLERTPALRSEFVSAQLSATLGRFAVELDRGAEEGSPVRVTWDDGENSNGALNAPLVAGAEPIIGDDVFNLSDLIFYFCGVKPVKVRKSKADPDSALVRLSFRDLMWYCFLQQDDLDSSFFQMQHPFKAYKSRDVMRFVTGLYSERMNELETKLGELVQSQRTKRESVAQIRQFMAQFHLASEAEFSQERDSVKGELEAATVDRNRIDQQHKVSTHALEPTRAELRKTAKEAQEIDTAIEDIEVRVQQQESLRSELITAKVKSSRAKQASSVLGNVDFSSCPRCASPVTPDRFDDPIRCCLCGQVPPVRIAERVGLDVAVTADLDSRIDDLGESISRHNRELARMRKRRDVLFKRRQELDQKLTQQLDRYDSAYTSSAREADSRVSQLQERLRSLERLAQMPAAITALEDEAAALQADIDRTKAELAHEQSRLVEADRNIEAVAIAFKHIMLSVGFPGVYANDRVHLDPRNWQPYVVHGDQEWTFTDAGSGGKKTLFNVCYALAVHRVALERNLYLPTLLMIDSPTKNITRDEDPELVRALYEQMYNLARDYAGKLQLILVDSHLVQPEWAQRGELDGAQSMQLDGPDLAFSHRRMPPPLIAYYVGP